MTLPNQICEKCGSSEFIAYKDEGEACIRCTKCGKLLFHHDLAGHKNKHNKQDSEKVGVIPIIIGMFIITFALGLFTRAMFAEYAITTCAVSDMMILP